MKNLYLKPILYLLFICQYLPVKAQNGTLYGSFPESFEPPREQSQSGRYKKHTVKLLTGDWSFFDVRVDSTANDHPSSGKFAARMGGDNTDPAILQMEFDLNQGASKVLIWYSSYAARKDKPCAFDLEYATDGGKNWTKIGQTVQVKKKVKEAATFDMDLKGKVRFRIVKLGLGNGAADTSIENGRLSIDDISVFKN